MPDPNLIYDPPEQWENTTIFKDNPTDVEVRPMFTRLFTQIQTFINTTLIAWVKDTFATKLELSDIALGLIPNDSLTEAQMANEMKKSVVGGVESFNTANSHRVDAVKHAPNAIGTVGQFLGVNLEGNRTEWKTIADASSTVKGIVELATDVEVTTGTSTTLVVTPAGVKVELDKKIPSTNLTLTTIVSDNLRASSDTARTQATSSYVKHKSFTINAGGIYRVKFDLKGYSASYAGFGRIYKNGVAFGTERTVATASYTTFSEDLAFAKDDTCELWIHNASVFATTVINFRLYYDTVIFDTDGTAIQNYDA